MPQEHQRGQARDQARQRAELLRRGQEQLGRAAALVDAEPDAVDDLNGIDGQLAVLGAALRDNLVSPTNHAVGTDVVAASTALANLHAIRYEIRDFLLHERLHRLDSLEAGLAKVRKGSDPDGLLNQVCQSVVESCGFDRVMLSRVEGSMWRPSKSYAVGEREAERNFRRWINAIPEIPLEHMLLETEMVRRQMPALVTDGANDRRVYRPLVEASGLSSYVAAPILSGGRVIGFLHADYQSRQVVSLDRDVLWAFAEAFSQIFERAVLLERLRAQREEVRTAMQTVESVLDDLADAEIELAGREHGTALPATRSIRTAAHPPSTVSSVLTGRELDVLKLMATGATNHQIASELVITDGTVKSHVKRILRKLGAENRAAAISQYLRLAAGQGSS